MHIHTIAAFAFLFWRLEAPPEWHFGRTGHSLVTALFALGLPVSVTVLALFSARKTRRTLTFSDDAQARAARQHHRFQAFLRLFLTVGFGLLVLATPWPDWVSLRGVAHELQIFGDLFALLPYVLGAIGIWIVAFPIELRLHGYDDTPVDGQERWKLGSYLDFHIRHHLLVIAGPMVLILFAANLTNGYESEIRRWSGSIWTPDVLLGLWAALVFLLAPLLLRRLWRTSPLGPGPLRDELLNLCKRVDLRCRDILVWKSDGLMINAAVMGILPAARFVLLSDALLASMTPRQVEAVFGHEAGHVRHRHMQHFLVFAMVGWLFAGVATEGFSWWFNRTGNMTSTAVAAIQGIGVAMTFIFWMVGFGWLSRRFERQADLFGARCVSPGATECHLPCSVHRGNEDSREKDRVCATGAAVFASALDRVATMSGISHDEPSWRHASVGDRIRFLHSAAGDPNRAIRFERLIRRVKGILLTTALLGSIGAVYYWTEIRPLPLRLEQPRLARELRTMEQQ